MHKIFCANSSFSDQTTKALTHCASVVSVNRPPPPKILSKSTLLTLFVLCCFRTSTGQGCSFLNNITLSLTNHLLNAFRKYLDTKMRYIDIVMHVGQNAKYGMASESPEIR